MASLNLSIEGPSIKSSYQSVISGPVPPSSSATAAAWALFTVKAPLLNAFQDTGAKDSILRVQGTGTGELIDLFEDFSEGHIQFAFVKVKDPNTQLPKNILIAWCGGGVPERTKGYFTSHLSAVSSVLHGYHVQITARSESDLDSDAIMRKIADASGSKYANTALPSSTTSAAPAPPPTAKKPVFTPTSSSRAAFHPLVAARASKSPVGDEDHDGWGADAPPVTRTELERVQSAYRPTKVNMSDILKKKDDSTQSPSSVGFHETGPAVVKGTYQPIGKVDIAAIRAQAKKEAEDDRPSPVKGAYEPVGKVDIAAIRARARKLAEQESPESAKSGTSSSNAFPPPAAPERLTVLQKPKVARKFGTTVSDFTGTKASTPRGIGFGGPSVSPAVPPPGSASRTFADQGGKTPAQLWAEKKSQASGTLGTTKPAAIASAVAPQPSVESGWRSGYTGKSWSVATPTYKREVAGGVDAHASEDTGSVDASAAMPSKNPLEDAPLLVPKVPRANQELPCGTRSPPPVPSPSQRSDDQPAPSTSTRPAESELNPDPEPETELETELREQVQHDSPTYVALPVSREVEESAEFPPRRSIHEPDSPRHTIPLSANQEPEPRAETLEHQNLLGDYDASNAEAGRQFGRKALALYDYDKAEDNEIELHENEYVTDIDMVDEDWWLGTNSQGERGLFPSNYVEIVEKSDTDPRASPVPVAYDTLSAAAPVGDAEPTSVKTPSAIALYDYEAAEDNELSFTEGANITGLEFPDEDWWFGHHNGRSGLFPANYVRKNP